jgi:hypothetical protein
MKRWLLSVVSPERLETVGLWLIVIGLLAEAALIANAMLFESIPPKFEKVLSAIFTIAIAAGVWIEHVGMTDSAEAKEQASRETISKIESRLAPRQIDEETFSALLDGQPKGKVEILYLDEQESMLLALQLFNGLRNAGWEIDGLASPIPPNSDAINSMFPLTFSVGANPAGVTLVINRGPSDEERTAIAKPGPGTTPYSVLARAILGAIGPNTVWGHDVACGWQKDLSPEIIRVVVAPKRIAEPPKP